MASEGIQRTRSVIMLTMIYAVNLLCIGGAFTIISFIYDTIGLYNLGQMTLLLNWFSYAVGILYTKQILNFFNELRTSLFVGWIIYGSPILVAMMAYRCYSSDSTTGVCNTGFIKFFNLSIAVLNGAIGYTYIWTGQYEFLNRISAEQEKKLHFSIFYSLIQFTGIFANILNIAFYSYDFSSMVMFSGFYIVYLLMTLSVTWILPEINGYKPEEHYLVVEPDNDQLLGPDDISGEKKPSIKYSIARKLSLIMEVDDTNKQSSLPRAVFLMTPSIFPISDDDSRLPSLRQAAQVYIDLAATPQMRSILPFMLQGGLFQMYGKTVTYRLVVDVYDGLDVADSRVKEMICVQAILLSIGAFLGSQLLKKIPPGSRNKTILFQSWTGTFCMILLYVLYSRMTNIWFALIPAFLIGGSEIGFSQLVSVYTAEEFPGSTEAFALFKQIQSLLSALNVLFYIMAPSWLFFTLSLLLFAGLSIWLRFSLK